MSLVKEWSSSQKSESSGHDPMEPASSIAENIFWNSSRNDSSWMLISVNLDIVEVCLKEKVMYLCLHRDLSIMGVGIHGLGGWLERREPSIIGVVLWGY